MPTTSPTEKRRIPRGAKVLLGGVAAYVLLAFVALPGIDRLKARLHPDPVGSERLTHTKAGAPGDPLNIGLVGSESDVTAALLAAGWRPADPLGLHSDIRIAVDTVADKPDPNAPVSDLFLFGRKEDLAFEKPIGNSPRERHHVRLWRAPAPSDGRTLWLGAATHDIRVEFSRTTEKITHRIDPDVDAERNLILADLESTKCLLNTRWIDGYHTVLEGRNGGGDPWHTDGRLAVATLAIAIPAKR